MWFWEEGKELPTGCSGIVPNSCSSTRRERNCLSAILRLASITGTPGVISIAEVPASYYHLSQNVQISPSRGEIFLKIERNIWTRVTIDFPVLLECLGELFPH